MKMCGTLLLFAAHADPHVGDADLYADPIASNARALPNQRRPVSSVPDSALIFALDTASRSYGLCSQCVHAPRQNYATLKQDGAADREAQPNRQLNLPKPLRRPLEQHWHLLPD